MYSKQKMNWHCDNESTIDGLIVASTSLGCSAHMSFGLKNTYSMGNKKKKIGKYRDIIPRASKFEEKTALKQKTDNGDSSQEEFDAALETLMKGVKKPRVPKAIIKFTLPGTRCIMVQLGQSLNKLYMHKVVNKGAARLVMTARKLKGDAGTVDGDETETDEETDDGSSDETEE
jgi:hypothetical protein